MDVLTGINGGELGVPYAPVFWSGTNIESESAMPSLQAGTWNDVRTLEIQMQPLGNGIVAAPLFFYNGVAGLAAANGQRIPCIHHFPGVEV